MKKILNTLYENKNLSSDEARTVLLNISEMKYNDAQIASFISVFLMRGISVEELEGFRTALLDLCVSIDLGGQETIDVCGTGGDGKDTFNISTSAAFVIAGAGYKVSKHGNYGVSSICGSSNVLEHLGYRFTNDADLLRRQLDQANICFFHAPLFHPALKSVGSIRKQLGVKTFFNLLGPLVNPARPTHQLTGVFDLKVFRLYQYLLEKTKLKFTIVHSLDGYDEVSLTGAVKLAQANKEMLVEPEYFGLTKNKEEDLFGGKNIQEAAAIFTKVLKGEGTQVQQNVVCANAALAIQTLNSNKPIDICFQEARESILNGKAFESFKSLVNCN